MWLGPSWITTRSITSSLTTCQVTLKGKLPMRKCAKSCVYYNCTILWYLTIVVTRIFFIFFACSSEVASQSNSKAVDKEERSQHARHQMDTSGTIVPGGALTFNHFHKIIICLPLDIHGLKCHNSHKVIIICKICSHDQT